ncbi:MAG TPA: TetR family transcriptional regulator [Rhizomicrobium sp.]
MRVAILDAARRLAARDGVEELSLTAVAAEAGFGQSTVFGHFRNKDELVLAILAEDLAGMATLMREHSLPLPEPAADDEHEVVANEPAAPFTEATEFSAPPAETRQSEAADSTSSPWLDGRFLSLVNDDHSKQEELAQEIHGLHEDSVANRPRVDAWLERRLRVFEHTLSDLERRLKETETNAARAVTVSDLAVTNLSDRVGAFEHRQTELSQSLLQRVEQTEQRQRGATSEMRAAMNDVATRIEILESARRAQARTADKAHANADNEGTSTAHQNSAATDEAYAEAAQRATDAAAALADMDHKPAQAPARAPVPSVWRTFAETRIPVSRRQYAVVAGGALLAFVIGAFVAFYVGHAHGRELASLAVPHKFHAKTVHSVAVVKRAPVRSAAVQHRSPAAPSNALAMLAQAGNAKAELLFGLRYLHGDGAAPDQPLAAQWIRRAAEQHDPLAQYWMGSLYEQGDGVSADSAEAVRWYEAAAGQGNRKAMHALGVAYAQGQGTQKDYSEAARWFAKGAALGLVNSQFNLAVLYERGLGVPQSLLDAYKWYAIAAAQGDRESRNRIEALKTQLAPDALAAAEGAAQQFRAQTPVRDANESPVLADLATSTVSHR